jgi:hypothetical protein
MEDFENSPPSLSTDNGPYNLGDVYWNQTPGIGAPLGWICTTPGQTGATAVFSPFAFIGAAAVYNTAANTTGFTATGAQVAGLSSVVYLALTGTLGGAANITLPTVAALLAAMPGASPGQTYTLRIINESAGAFAWTVVTDTGWTLVGTMSIAQDTWRDFIVNITSVASATATLTSVGTGTYS